MKRPFALLILLATLGATGCIASRTTSGPGASPSVSTLASPPAPAPATVPQTGVTAPSGGNLVQLSGQARSVETTAAVAGLGSVHLSGAPEAPLKAPDQTLVLTITGADVVDAAGRDQGIGTLTGQGSDVVITGNALTLSGTLRVQPSVATISGASVAMPGPATVTAGRFSFQAPTPTEPAGRPMASPSAPPPVTLTGPVTIRTPGLAAGVSGTALRWVDVPGDVAVTSGEADLSWPARGRSRRPPEP